MVFQGTFQGAIQKASNGTVKKYTNHKISFELFSDLGLVKTSTNLLDIADQFCETFFIILIYFLEVII